MIKKNVEEKLRSEHESTPVQRTRQTTIENEHIWIQYNWKTHKKNQRRYYYRFAKVVNLLYWSNEYDEPSHVEAARPKGNENRFLPFIQFIIDHRNKLPLHAGCE